MTGGRGAADGGARRGRVGRAPRRRAVPRPGCRAGGGVSRRAAAGWAFVLLALVGIGTAAGAAPVAHRSSVPATHRVATRPGRATPVAAAATPTVPLAAAIDALLAGEPGVYGVVLVGPDGETLYARNADAPFVAASLYKLVVMAAIHAARVEGDLTLEEEIFVEGSGWATIEDALATMIVDSSNEAALALLDRVGGEAVNRTAADLGLAGTCVDCDPTTRAGWPLAAGAGRREDDADRAALFVLGSAAPGWSTVTTPNDVARFYALLLDGEVVDRRSSVRMLRLLARQAVADRFPVLLPKGTGVAHKTGNLPGVVHDAGVVSTPAGPVVLVALAQDVPDECRAVVALRRLAAIAYAAHAGAASVEGRSPRDAAADACASI